MSFLAILVVQQVKQVPFGLGIINKSAVFWHFYWESGKSVETFLICKGVLPSSATFSKNVSECIIPAIIGQTLEPGSRRSSEVYKSLIFQWFLSKKVLFWILLLCKSGSFQPICPRRDKVSFWVVFLHFRVDSSILVETFLVCKGVRTGFTTFTTLLSKTTLSCHSWRFPTVALQDLSEAARIFRNSLQTLSIRAGAGCQSLDYFQECTKMLKCAQICSNIHFCLAVGKSVETFPFCKAKFPILALLRGYAPKVHRCAPSLPFLHTSPAREATFNRSQQELPEKPPKPANPCWARAQGSQFWQEFSRSAQKCTFWHLRHLRSVPSRTH